MPKVQKERSSKENFYFRAVLGLLMIALIAFLLSSAVTPELSQQLSERYTSVVQACFDQHAESVTGEAVTCALETKLTQVLNSDEYEQVEFFVQALRDGQPAFPTKVISIALGQSLTDESRQLLNQYLTTLHQVEQSGDSDSMVGTFVFTRHGTVPVECGSNTEVGTQSTLLSFSGGSAQEPAEQRVLEYFSFYPEVPVSPTPTGAPIGKIYRVTTLNQNFSFPGVRATMGVYPQTYPGTDERLLIPEELENIIACARNIFPENLEGLVAQLMLQNSQRKLS